MARDAYYFSHDSNARHDLRVVAVIAKYKAAGYGWYFMLIELLRDQNNYILQLDDDTIATISKEIYCPRPQTRPFIDYCISKGLFRSDGECFWSESLLRRMDRMEAKSDCGRNAANARWHSERNADAMRTHSERNAMKRKEKKEKETPDPDALNEQETPEEVRAIVRAQFGGTGR